MATADHAWNLLDSIQADKLIAGAAPETVLDDDTVLFRTPLAERDRFGNRESLSRDDFMYTWVAEKIEHRVVAGAMSLGVAPRTIVTMSLRTMPDHQFVDYADGVGVVRYVYGHHGTTAEANLVEFIRGDAATGGSVELWRNCGGGALPSADAPSKHAP